MQPKPLDIGGNIYQAYEDLNGKIYPAAPIEKYALKRIFSLQKSNPKIIDFDDFEGDWAADSMYISSPDDSEITVEVLDSNGYAFYKDKFTRNQTPFKFPTVVFNKAVKLRLTASRNDILLCLIYFRPVYLEFYKDHF